MPEQSGEFKKSSFNLKKVINKTLVAAIVGGTVACTPVDARPVIPPIVSDKTPPATAPIKEPTISSTPNPTEVPTVIVKATETLAPTPTYVVEASGGVYTSTQEKLNQSTDALAQQQRVERWLDYWIQFDNRPFAPETTDIHWKYIYDNPKNPTEVWVLMEVGGEYQNKLFTVPMNETGFVDYPPTVAGNDIQPGLGPLEINPNKDGTFLSVDQGVPVRINSQGEIVERLVKAQWEKESLIKGNIFQDPQSKEEFKDLVVAPSPIDEPEKFALWQDEYLKLVNEKAEEYRDKAINEPFGIAGETGNFIFGSSVWVPISAYKFIWQHQEILNKTFLYRVPSTGGLVPITLTYTPEDSRYFDTSGRYTTPSGVTQMELYVKYAYREQIKKENLDIFIDEFVPEVTDSEWDAAVIRIWRDNELPTKSDYDLFSRTNLIMIGFREKK